MGCCTSTPHHEPLIAPDPVDPTPLDPTLVRFKEMYDRGHSGDVIPTRVVAIAMGTSAVSMGRMLAKWGYQLDRRYLDGKRERVVVGVKELYIPP